jgi:hypothetical protein
MSFAIAEDGTLGWFIADGKKMRSIGANIRNKAFTTRSRIGFLGASLVVPDMPPGSAEMILIVDCNNVRKLLENVFSGTHKFRLPLQRIPSHHQHQLRASILRQTISDAQLRT